MEMSIYLHDEIFSVLKCFGDLSDVVNKMLADLNNHDYDICDKPPCPGREGAGRYIVNITESSYLELLEAYSINSPRISLRRLLYWFVENEIYNELGWEPIHNFVDKRAEKYYTKLDNAINELKKAERYACNFDKDKIANIIELIKNIKENTKDG